jgi:hypothetical protein
MSEEDGLGRAGPGILIDKLVGARRKREERCWQGKERGQR